MVDIDRQMVVTVISALVLGSALGSLFVTDAEMRQRDRIEAESGSRRFNHARFWLFQAVVLCAGLVTALVILKFGDGRPLSEGHRLVYGAVLFGAVLLAKYIRHLIWREK